MLFFFLFLLKLSVSAGKYQSFKVTIYVPAWEIAQMVDDNWLRSTWSLISNQIKVDKVFIETYRDGRYISAELIEKVKSFFLGQGLEIAGGITFTQESGPHPFNSFCYTDPVHQEIVQNLSRFTAEHFDSFILDDFFFTNCRSDVEIANRGNLSWTEYRLNTMHDAGRKYVVGAAKSVNPNVNVIIKYPNWYDHFPGLGFDLKEGPTIFGSIWTGTETRDSETDQHLQNYLSYNVIRYFDNVAQRAGKQNGGGWVDPYGLSYGLDRYAEQLWLTMFAKAPEIALFNYNDLRGVTLNEQTHRAKWQGQNTSFDYDEMIQNITVNGNVVVPTTIARTAGYVFEKIDQFVYLLGNPIGIKQYKPFNSYGEDFLQNYFGMIGVPIEMVTEFPEDQDVVFLTEQAKYDEDIVSKIQKHLKRGKSVVITTGLLKAIPEKIATIAELKVGKPYLVNDFARYGKIENPILINEIYFQTNDGWNIISAGRPLAGGTSGTPILLRAPFSKGNLYVLSIPDDFGNLYNYPQGVLDTFRELLTRDLEIRILGPAKIGLFLYDNGYFIVESFLDEESSVNVIIKNQQVREILDVLENQTISKSIWGAFGVDLKPHSFRVFKQVK